MSLADKASLLLIPTGYKSQKVYSIFPTDGVGDFDFSRSSSATRIAKNGLITSVAANVPRLEYPLIDGVVSGCPSLLLEPSRTNLLTYSSGFVTDWNNTNITINSNSIISPDGTLNATKFIPNNTSSQHYLDRNSIVVNSNASASIFAKKGEHQRFAINSYFTGANAVFDLGIGSVLSSSSVTAKIEDYGNGWYRCSLNETLNVNYGYGIFVMQNDSLSKSDSYSGNGIDGMYFYGAQLEEGSYPTSYIKSNSGTTTTRAAETATGAGDASTFNDSEGVLMMEVNTSDTSAVPVISLSNGSASNEIEFAYYGTNQWNFILRVSGGTPNVVGTVNASDFNKFCVAYTTTDFNVYLNGFLVGSNTLPSPLSGLNVLDFNFPSGSNKFYGNTKQIQYYNSALTDSELETLTSWTSFTDLANGQQYSIK